MYAMQYAITLPTDYDMQIIRDRVTRSGHLLDGFPGLDFKAYLIREKANGAPANEYAPFYLWNDIEGMRSFCWGEPGYSAIVRDFGRHPIQDWTIAGITRGPAPLAQARSMTMTTRPLPGNQAPSQTIPALTQEFLNTTTPSTVRRIAAIDVTGWTLLLAELTTEPAGAGGTSYEVLHLSPGPHH